MVDYVNVVLSEMRQLYNAILVVSTLNLGMSKFF